MNQNRLHIHAPNALFLLQNKLHMNWSSEVNAYLTTGIWTPSSWLMDSKPWAWQGLVLDSNARFPISRSGGKTQTNPWSSLTAFPRSFIKKKKGNPQQLYFPGRYRWRHRSEPLYKFIRLRFSSPIPDPDERRLIATLWGCIRRRVFFSTYAFFSTTPNDLCLDYQDSEGYFIPET